MKKQNVLIVHNHYQLKGGEDSVVENENKMLVENGHKVLLYTRNNTELKSMGIGNKILLPFITLFNFKTYIDIKRIIKKEKIDIVHVHNTLNLISPAVYYAAIKCKVPVVQTVHNFRLVCPGATFYRDGHICEDCVEKGLLNAVKHRCYRNSRIQTLACVITTVFHRWTGIYKKLNYICLTEFNKKKIRKLDYFKDVKVFTKPNFVKNTDIILPYKDREKQIVFVGRLDEIKGIEVLLNAWKNFTEDDVKLVICGTGPKKEWCEKFITDNNMKNVVMCGLLPNDKVKKIIGSSLALVLPTQWYEGFPMVIAEAYSVGTPVIASDIGNVGDLVKDGESGIKFHFDSPEHLAYVIRKFLENEMILSDEYIQMYSEKSNYELLQRIYHEVMDDSNR